MQARKTTSWTSTTNWKTTNWKTMNSLCAWQSLSE